MSAVLFLRESLSLHRGNEMSQLMFPTHIPFPQAHPVSFDLNQNDTSRNGQLGTKTPWTSVLISGARENQGTFCAMDTDCYHLVYNTRDVLESESYIPPCQHCADCSVPKNAIPSSVRVEAGEFSAEQTLTGPMVPYVQAFQTEAFDAPGAGLGLFFYESETPLFYVQKGFVIAQQGAIHMRDVSPYGTWLSDQKQCLDSLTRLRLAGLVCVRTPELNRIVLEQKNDDGLLHLANEWLLNNDNVNESVELFGPFACDAMLAPVLHKILRSEWIEERKGLAGTNNELKLGWAQEFYDWRTLVKDSRGSAIFTPVQCPREKESSIKHSYKTITGILEKMKWCGYTPWAAVQAVRCSETRLSNMPCKQCAVRTLNACVFLMECAAVEASREHDWLVRNEAVIELCWLLHKLGRPDNAEHELLEAWAEAVAIHSIRFYERSLTGSLLMSVHAFLVMFSVDHLPKLSGTKPKLRVPFREGEGPEVDAELLRAIERNERFVPKRICYAQEANPDSANVSSEVEVPGEVPDWMEAAPQQTEAIARALVSCFPRVAASALGDLTLNVPTEQGFSGKIWPVFVNPTRACYQLFRAAALPSSPSPAYVLELLARSWRCVRAEAFASFLPTSSCGSVKVGCDHYAKHLAGPVETLARIGAISESEKELMLRTLSVGVLPCFAADGDSAPDRLVNSTLAITFAASGLRMFGPEEEEEEEEGHRYGLYRSVTRAGLLYFAAWYVLVYAGAVHAHPTLKSQLSRNGSDADRHLCSALKMTPAKAESRDCLVLDQNVKEFSRALETVLGDQLDASTVRRCVELYVPELLTQLPYAKKLHSVPCNVKSAIESRDAWFAKERSGQSRPEDSEIPFAYLGKIAHGLYSSVKGTLSGKRRRAAEALHGINRDFDPWCDTLLASRLQDEELDIEAFLRLSIHDQSNETFYQLDQSDVSELGAPSE